jgi:hypothetical protein
MFSENATDSVTDLARIAERGRLVAPLGAESTLFRSHEVFDCDRFSILSNRDFDAVVATEVRERAQLFLDLHGVVQRGSRLTLRFRCDNV